MNVVDDARISAFLHTEAGLLNDELYKEWLDLLTEDFEYKVPAPVLRDDPRQPRYSDTSLLAWESTTSLRYRFERISMTFAWADRPPAFHRRHISAVRPIPGGTARAGEHLVRSDVLLVRSREPEGTVIVSAGREDLLRETDGALKLARRTVFLDTGRPALAHVASLF